MIQNCNLSCLVGDYRCGFVSLSQDGGSCTLGRTVFLPASAFIWVCVSCIPNECVGWYQQTLPRCPSPQHMCASGLQDKPVKWVPWDFPASQPSFWPLWDFQWAWQLRQRGLAMGTWVVFLGFSLLAALALAFGATLAGQKVWLASLPLKHHFLFSDSPTDCSVSPCWGHQTA